jgi:hypothetical protein
MDVKSFIIFGPVHVHGVAGCSAAQGGVPGVGLDQSQ